MNIDPFSYLEFGANSLSSDANMRGTVASAFQLLLALGIIGLMVTVIIAAIRIAFAPPAKRAEALSDIGTKVIVGICLFGATTIISTIYYIVTNFAAGA